MFNLGQQERIRFGFWLLSLLPVVFFFVAFRTTSSLIRSADDVAQTNEVVKRLQNLLSVLKDVEVAQREFVLTGDERDLQPYYAARTTVDQDLAKLRELTAENQRQKEWLNLLEPLVPQKFDEIKRTIDLRKRAGQAAASRVLLTNQGAQAMDDIRRVIRRMLAEEDALLKSRTKEQKQTFLNTMLTFGVVILMNVAFVWMMSWVIKRDLAERRREEARIRLLNAELERRVENRTEALRRSNDDLQQFAYIASHDLQEPLRMVASYTELLQKRYKGKLDPDADEFIAYAVDGVKRMSALIKDLLEYSRVGSMQDDPPETVDMNEIVESALFNLRGAIEDSGAKVTSDKMPTVSGNRMRLTQLLQNLIGNALKYRGKKQPVIHVSARVGDGDTTFSVKDNGIGIDPQYKDQIFGIFKRLHGKQYEGTGIGLAMCKKIVERQGGRIWVDSQVGEGSTFHFTVPHRPAMPPSTSSLRPPPPPVSTPPPPAPIPAAGRRI